MVQPRHERGCADGYDHHPFQWNFHFYAAIYWTGRRTSTVGELGRFLSKGRLISRDPGSRNLADENPESLPDSVQALGGKKDVRD